MVMQASIEQIRIKLGAYCNRSQFAGDTTIVLRNGTPCAKIVPLSEEELATVQGREDGGHVAASTTGKVKAG